eukprot:TRINITY_DN2616_c0_g1_i4.p1 TRINITY_DN2616_c0_g1~~TRINITY_DN2616_c0_g1_i4.p1  ORF type:complete len:894 (-),score=157.10 TRINITY_DN2616_c0_g1_i4:43-2724(-)
MQRGGCRRHGCECAAFSSASYLPKVCSICFHDDHDHPRRGDPRDAAIRTSTTSSRRQSHVAEVPEISDGVATPRYGRATRSSLAKTPSAASIVGSTAQSISSQQPSISSQQPSISSQHPSISSQQPSISSQHPSISSQQPSISSQHPSISSIASTSHHNGPTLANLSSRPQTPREKSVRKAKSSRNIQDRRKSAKSAQQELHADVILELKKSNGEVSSPLQKVKPTFSIPILSMLPVRSTRENAKINTSRNSVDLAPSAEKVLKFALRSLDVGEDKLYELLQLISAARLSKRPLLDQDQICHLHQIQFEVEALLSEQNLRRAVRLVEHRYVAKLERRKFLELRRSGLIPRNLLIMELVRSEKQYIDLLKSCYQHYFTPFLQNLSQIILVRANYFPDQAGMKSIFGKFDSLYYFHCDFILHFTNMTTVWPFIDGKIGGIFKKMISSFKIYDEYANNFRHSKDTLSRYEENSLFHTYLQNIVTQNPGVLPLNASLTIPLQRASQYETILQEILDKTPASHTDHEDLAEVCVEMKRVCAHIQSKLERSVDRAQVLNVMRRMKDGHNHINLDSRFIHEGDVFTILETRLSQRHAFLFDDRIVITKQESRNSFKFSKMFHMSRVRLRNLPDAPYAKYLFELVLEDQAVLFGCPSLEDKMRWIQFITDILSYRVSNTVFGVPLENLLYRDPEKKVVPDFIQDAMEMIKKHGISSEGIFRVPGEAAAVEKLREELDSGHGYDYRSYDPNTIASVIKMWLRDLPEPLIPYDLYDKALEANATHNLQYKKLAFMLIISQIPDPNRSILYHFAQFLFEVSQHSEENKMTIQNLSTVFGPNIIRPRMETLQSVPKIPYANAALQFMIQNHEEVFSIPEFPSVGPQEHDQQETTSAVAPAISEEP